MRPCFPALLTASLLLPPIACPVASAQTPVTRGPDGRTTSFVPGITVLPIPGKPFSAEEAIDWSRPTDGQGILLSHLTAKIVRDTQGRLYREYRGFIPAGSSAQSPLRASYIYDPVNRTLTTCVRAERTCTITDYQPVLTPVVTPVGPFDKGRRTLTRQSLGADTMLGVSIEGTRETTSITPGTLGNDAVLVITRDLWRSPELAVDLRILRHDPREGDQFIHLLDLSRAEPDPQIFTLPAGYRIKDARSPVTAAPPVQTAAQPPRAPDGHTDHIVSGIDLLNIPGKPFSADDVIDATKPTDGQGTIATHIVVKVARDIDGRVYRELRNIAPPGSDAPSILVASFVYDPIRRVQTVCVYAKRTCSISPYRPVMKFVPQPAGPFDRGTRFLTRETLGSNTMENLPVEGTRETTTITPGTDGNNVELYFTTDFWYSPDLETNLVAMRHDPRYGTQLFHLTNLVRADLSPQVFAIPTGFTVKDLRFAVSAAK